MSNESDTGPAMDDKETSSLLALLYPDEEVEKSAPADDSAPAELEGMLGLRSLFAAMPEEEPPDAISNKLLAMAAQHAPTPKVAQREKPGLWARISGFLMPMGTNPGLMAAASLALVAGVAGTLYYKGGLQMTEPTTSSKGPEPTASAAPLSSAAASESHASKDKAELDLAPSSALPEKPVQQGVPARILEPEPSSTSAQEIGKNQRALPGAKAKKKRKRSQQNAISGGYAQGSLKDYLSETENKKEAKKSAPAPVQVTAPVPAPPSAPKPASQAPTPSAPELDSEDSDEEGQLEIADSKTAKPVAITKVSALHKQAVAAAKRENCSQVRSLGRQIKALDSSYYQRVFRADAKLRSCLQSAKKR